MNNRNILFILILLLVYLNVFIPLSDKNRLLQKKIIATQNSIEKDKLYILNKDRINKDINQSITQYKMNEIRYFYQEESNQVFNLLQKEIKSLISKNNTHEDNIKWGEKYETENTILFPISVRITGAIKNIGNFFDDINNNPKIHIKDFTIRRTKNFYIMQLSLYGVKSG